MLLDGGIRRGSDVVKALALGARAVMIGRAYLWGLAANGSAGVRNVFDILRGGIDSALLGLGRASVHDLTPDDVLVPPGFTRGLGLAARAGRRLTPRLSVGVSARPGPTQPAGARRRREPADGGDAGPGTRVRAARVRRRAEGGGAGPGGRVRADGIGAAAAYRHRHRP